MTKYKIDDYGRKIWTETGLKERLITGETLRGLTVEETDNTRRYLEIQAKRSPFTKPQFNIVEDLDILPKDFHNIKKTQYLIPDTYINMDIEEYLIAKVVKKKKKSRLLYELDMYKKRDMYPILKMMVYLVDIFRENNILWGVGRGSSVSSFVLYLIGINRINPLKYGLDIHEFLR